MKNANLVKKKIVYVFQTDLILSILKWLKFEGFIDDFEKNILCGNSFCVLVKLRFKGPKLKPYITKLKRVSRPGLRFYVKASNLPVVEGGVGISILKI